MNLADHVKYALLIADDERLIRFMEGAPFAMLVYPDGIDMYTHALFLAEIKKRGIRIRKQFLDRKASIQNGEPVRIEVPPPARYRRTWHRATK